MKTPNNCVLKISKSNRLNALEALEPTQNIYKVLKVVKPKLVCVLIGDTRINSTFIELPSPGQCYLYKEWPTIGSLIQMKSYQSSLALKH